MLDARGERILSPNGIPLRAVANRVGAVHLLARLENRTILSSKKHYVNRLLLNNHDNSANVNDKVG